ncbi:MAG TPA: oligosaccharide flippase family protein [Conexibacter sp.]|nr:oligosaccharide flippase family protein [Conexibacter sp.]
MAFALASFGTIGVLTLASSILTARIYGVTVVGEAALALAPVMLVTLLSTVREQPAMVRKIAKLEPRDPAVTGIWLAVLSFSFVLTAVVAALGVVACWFVFNGPIDHPDLFAPAATGLVGYLLVINTCWNIDGVLGAFRAGRELFAVRLHQALVYTALIVVLGWVSHSVWSLTIAFLLSWTTALVHRLALVPRVMRWRVPRADLRAGFGMLREIVTFGLKITPGSIAGGLSDASGTWILGVTSSVTAVGAFSRASNVAQRLGELNWRVTEMLLPTLVERRAAGDVEGSNRVVADSLRYAAFGMLLPAAVGGGASHAVMQLFGSGFAPAASALCWLLIAPWLQTLTAIQGSLLMAANRPLWTSFAQSARLLVTLAAGILLTNAIGLTGMAIAIAAGCLASFGVYVVIMRSLAALPTPRPARLARQLVGLAASYAAGFFSARAVEQQVSGIAQLPLALLAGSLAFCAVALVVAGTLPRDRERLRGLWRTLRDRQPRTRRAMPSDVPAGAEDVAQ